MAFWQNLTLKQSMFWSALLITVLISFFEIRGIFRFYDTQTITNQIIQSRSPTVVNSIKMMNGLKHSLSLLESLTLPESARFKTAFTLVWEKEVNPSFEALKRLAPAWQDNADREALAEIETLLEELNLQEQEILDIIESGEGSPARQLFFDETIPAGEKVLDDITKLIELEAKEPATIARKTLLKHMADMRGSLGTSMSVMRAYLISGETKFKTEFSEHWASNEQAFNELNNQVA
ncbi:MAG: hypothetical protein AAF512_04165, partial [Pseudomonadota bacterium]